MSTIPIYIPTQSIALPPPPNVFLASLGRSEPPAFVLIVWFVICLGGGGGGNDALSVAYECVFSQKADNIGRHMEYIWYYVPGTTH